MVLDKTSVNSSVQNIGGHILYLWWLENLVKIYCIPPAKHNNRIQCQTPNMLDEISNWKETQ